MEPAAATAVKTVLREWVEDGRQALLDRMTDALREAQEPDQALAERILAALPAPGPDTEGSLGKALELLDQATTQGEVLKNLLEALRDFIERSALFIVKQGIASLYVHKGFEGEHPRPGAPVVPPPELEDLIQNRVSHLDAQGPATRALLAPLSRLEAKDIRVFPIHLRRKTVAILLGDGGSRGAIRHPNHLRLLVLAAESRLSYLAGIKEEERTAAQEVKPHTLTQRIPDPLAEVSASLVPAPLPGPAAPREPALDPKLKANAERSARVLVGDMELYFPAKVAQGQQSGNLCGAMKEELERSRAAFLEKYGTDLENRHQIFYQTVVQQLCGGDPSRLGPAPWLAR